MTNSPSLLPPFLHRLQRYRSLLLPVGFIALLAVVVVPLPPVVMDLLLVANLALAALILMTTIFVTSPLDFSVFPSLLLGTTLMRLVLNIATTRLILGAEGSSAEEARDAAGSVIETFASMVTSGSLVVGAILFIILIIVQFVVITKGATRISEVAARFTLDAMPGKQMAIDADLNAGLIDERDAKRRREEISSEADFYGAMDGAAKFVRGDAIAGILITLINVLGGFAIGVFQNGWGLAESAEVFTSLTIGDGLVSQIPALIISIAAGLIVTRSSGKSDLGTDLTGQLTGKSAALGVTAAFLGVMAFTGLPMLPLLALAAVLGGLWWVMSRNEGEVAARAAARADESAQADAEPEPIDAALAVDALELEVGYGLVKLVDQSQGGDLLERISGVRRQLAGELGVVMPPVRIHDNMQLSPQDYHIKLRGNIVASGRLYPGQLLAIDSGAAPADGPALRGTATREPAFGQRALWIESGQRSRAESLHYVVVGPSEVAATHLAEVVRSHAAEMLSREETATLITNLREKAPKLCEEVLGSATGGSGGAGGGSSNEGLVRPGELQRVLQNLLSERVPIRDLETIVETLGDWATRTKDLEVLTEYVRNALRRDDLRAVRHDRARERRGRRADGDAAVLREPGPGDGGHAERVHRAVGGGHEHDHAAAGGQSGDGGGAGRAAAAGVGGASSGGAGVASGAVAGAAAARAAPAHRGGAGVQRGEQGRGSRVAGHGRDAPRPRKGG